MTYNITLNTTLSNIINSHVNITNTFFSSLTQYGLFDIILPFLLIFSLIFMILELSGLLKTSEDDVVGRRLSALFSFSFALLSMANKSLVAWLYSFIPSASLLILAFFLFAMLIGLTGKRIPGFAKAILSLVMIGLILWLAVNALKVGGNSNDIANVLSYILDVLIQSGLLGIIILILVLVFVVSWAVGGKQEEESD